MIILLTNVEEEMSANAEELRKEKPAPVPLHSLQDMSRDRTRAAAVGSRRLSA
jgi:hypothetical protein